MTSQTPAVVMDKYVFIPPHVLLVLVDVTDAIATLAALDTRRLVSGCRGSYDARMNVESRLTRGVRFRGQ